MEPIILASASPRRKDLLIQAGIPFEIHPSNIDENTDGLSGTPEQIAEFLAHMKANDVAKKISEGLVLGADTIVVLDSEIFGKPNDAEDARKMLEKLSGRVHKVITGIALIDSKTGLCRIGHEVTKVKFAQITSDEIEKYIKTGEPFGKAGAYAVQGFGALLVEKIDGCYTNVVGLPLMRLKKLFKEFKLETM